MTTRFEAANYKGYYERELSEVRWGTNTQGMARCPFHDDHTPSLSINSETGKYFCHGCGAKGGIVSFHMKRHGLEHDEAREALAQRGLVQSVARTISASYDYVDESGRLLFQVVRYEPKSFPQRRPDGQGGWINNLEGVERVLYKLPEVIEADQVFIVEGEKDVETLRRAGLAATCNSGGAGNWRQEYNEYLRGKSVVIIPDNDEPGQAHAQSVARNIHGIASSVKVLELPGLDEGGDATDWFENGGKKQTLMRLVRRAEKWSEGRVADVTDVTVGTEDLSMPVCAFPMHVFSDSFRRFIDEASTALHVESQLVAVVALSIISGAIGNSIAISPRPGYTVNPFIWAIVIAESGSGKTPVMSTLMRHIEHIQSQEHVAYEQDVARFRMGQEAARIDHLVFVSERPILRHLYVSDCTVESLVNVYENNKRGIIVHTDEIARLMLGFDQYRGKGNDRQHYVELFNGNSWKLDRKSGSRMISNTGAAIIGGIQPKRMPNVFKEDAFDDGLLPRFLLYQADSTVRRFNQEGLRAETIAYWDRLIDQCYAIPLNIDENDFAKPKVLTLSEEALNVYTAYYDMHAELAPFRNGIQRMFVQKLIAYYALKFAGVLHTMRGFYRRNLSEIQVDTMQKALVLTDFFAGQATKTMRLYVQEKQLDEFQRRLIISLRDVEGLVNNGKIPLSIIHERFNDQLPERLRMTSKKVAITLRDLGLQTTKSNHNRSYVIWEAAKIDGLFSHLSVTTVTQTATPDEEKDRYVSPKVITMPSRTTIARRRRKAANDEST